MSFVRMSLLVSALGLTACVSQRRVQKPIEPTWFELCIDPRFKSICKPASASDPARPIQIDTNLAIPRAGLHLG